MSLLPRPRLQTFRLECTFIPLDHSHHHHHHSDHRALPLLLKSACRFTPPLTRRPPSPFPPRWLPCCSPWPPTRRPRRSPVSCNPPPPPRTPSPGVYLYHAGFPTLVIGSRPRPSPIPARSSVVGRNLARRPRERLPPGAARAGLSRSGRLPVVRAEGRAPAPTPARASVVKLACQGCKSGLRGRSRERGRAVIWVSGGVLRACGVPGGVSDGRRRRGPAAARRQTSGSPAVAPSSPSRTFTPLYPRSPRQYKRTHARIHARARACTCTQPFPLVCSLPIPPPLSYSRSIYLCPFISKRERFLCPSVPPSSPPHVFALII